MFPFERYMKKLKGYVRTKAKPEGSTAEGYVAEEALNFSSHYFRDVTMKFNHLDHNVDPLPQRVGFRCSDRPEIDTYRSQFKSLFPNKDMQEEFPDWFGSQTGDKTQRLALTSEFIRLVIDHHGLQSSVNSCVGDGCSCRQIESLKDDTEAVPFTYTINGHEIQFGREEFCLITGLRFGVEFSDDYLHGPLDLRRRVWESHVDGNNIIGQMLIDKILSEEFYSLRDEDAVAVCLLAVLHMVLLGQEPKNNVPKWWLSLVDDINMWEKYPWGSYIWPKLYRQLKDANPKRWDRFYASLRGPIRRPAKYTLSGFTWAFKTWILEAYKERALNYYTHVDRHPRAVAWVNGETFYRSYLEPFFEGAEPIRRLRADAFEAKAEWWVSSRAFFDGHICEPPQIPTAVSNDLYQRVAEHNRLIKELQQHNVDQYKIMNSMNKNFKEGLNASSMPGPMKAPFEVREHFGLSDLSGFQNTKCGPQLFTTQARGSFLEGTQTTPTSPLTPHIGTPMSQHGFASCSSRYLPSHPGTPYVGTSLALQGFAPFSFNYQAGPSHSRDVFGVDAMQRAKRDTRPSKYFLSPYRPLPETTIAPTKRVNNNRKTTRNDEISPFDPANAGIDLNQPLEEEVMVTSSCATDECLSFYNVDPAKVVRGQYVDCMTFLNAPEYVYLDCYMKGYTVGVQFWQELVPLLCKVGYYEHQKLSEVGWLSDDMKKKFNLESNDRINLSVRLPSFDSMMDITDDEEVQFFVECACSTNEISHLYVSQPKKEEETANFRSTNQNQIFYKFFEHSPVENIGPSNIDLNTSNFNNNDSNMSFFNNGPYRNFESNDYQNNESGQKIEHEVSKPESSFAFGSFNENENEQDHCFDGVDENPQPIHHKWKKFMSFKSDIPETPLYKSKPVISKHYNKVSDVKIGNTFDNQEALDLAVRLKALEDGTVTRIKTDEEGVFEMLFIALGASIRTFVNHLRPLLIIDAAHLKGQYKGTNLVAVGMDGNNQIVPIAFGICKGETGPCWSWWMSVLKECIGDNPNLLFISNRHAAIALAVRNEFPLAFHAQKNLEATWTYSKQFSLMRITSLWKSVLKDGQEPIAHLYGIPCGHVIAVTRFLGLTDCVQFVADWFKKEKYQGTYAESIHFVGDMHEWELPSHIHPAIPPRMDNPQPGRPKNTNRILSQGEEPRTMLLNNSSLVVLKLYVVRISASWVISRHNP
ncbi:transposase, MuDR, MULE transposase domain protein [Tanacetum coccineum]